MKKNMYAVIIVLALLVGACSLPSMIGTSPAPAPAANLPSGQATTPAIAVLGSPTPNTVLTISFSTLTPTFPGELPGDPSTVVAATKDEAYPATTGDVFSINRYERPYQLDKTYRPDADIAATYIGDNGEWYYFSTEVMGPNPATKTLDTPFGFEIDFDRDGRGDFLLWATPPFSPTWTNTDVQVYADTNRDVGNRRPMLSDAPSTLQSDGYETVVVSNGSGAAPGAAWARQSPQNPNTLQIAVKKSLINQASFLFWGWTDFDLGKATVFDYNDIFTAQQAGSPYPGDPNYPLKELFGMDNTCRVAYGFTPVGNEPGLCGGVQPVSTIKVIPTVGGLKTAIPGIKPTNTPTIYIKVITDTPTLPPPPPPVCSNVQVGAQVTDGSTWDPSWASGVTLCVGGDCKNPDSNGYATWSLPAGVYTIKASSTFGITPDSATVKLGCGEKSLSQFVIGPG
jgi:hypothetical protein